MEVPYVEAISPEDPIRVCDGEAREPEGVGACNAEAEFLLLWVGYGGEAIALCPDCLARLVEQGRWLLERV